MRDLFCSVFVALRARRLTLSTPSLDRSDAQFPFNPPKHQNRHHPFVPLLPILLNPSLTLRTLRPLPSLAAAYGFLFKPSTLWPPPPPEFQKRAKESTSLHGLKHAAELYTSSHSSKSKSNFLPHLNRDKKGKELASKIEGLPDEDPQRAEGSTKDEGHKQSTGEVGETLKLKIDGEEVEVTDQIQLYATNDQVRFRRN